MVQSSRLLWRCRRGMQEMDILLEYYLTKCYKNVSSIEQKNFEQMLDETDMDIFSWITKRSMPPEKYIDIITDIQKINISEQ